MPQKERLENLNKRRKLRLKLGDIYEIPLPSGLNAYGRLYKEYVLAIYQERCVDVMDLPEDETYEFLLVSIEIYY